MKRVQVQAVIRGYNGDLKFNTTEVIVDNSMDMTAIGQGMNFTHYFWTHTAEETADKAGHWVGEKLIPQVAMAAGEALAAPSHVVRAEAQVVETVEQTLVDDLAEVAASGGDEGAEAAAQMVDEGSFSISDWTGYPEGGPRPTGPFRLVEGAEYEQARRMSNRENARLHRSDPLTTGKEIHEIHPIKFGGSPTNPINKIYLSPAEHRLYNRFWYQMQRNITRNP